MQRVEALAPAADPFPCGQGRHVSADVAPTVVEYVPAGQFVQGVLAPSNAYVPARH